MKRFEIPACKEQKEFENLIKTLVKVAAELPANKTDELLEFAMKLAYEEKH